MPERPPTILFVDDDVGNRQLLCLVFRDRSYLVHEADTGNEALELARRLRPDLIVLDINLPDVNGFEVCRRLREDTDARPAILLLSGEYIEADHRTAGLEGGGDAYLTKPVDTHELLAVARALLRARAAEEATRQAANQWRTTFDAIGDAVCLLDATGAITRCNRALAALVGLGFERLIGRKLDEVMREAFGAEAEGLGLSEPAGREGRELALHGRWFHVACDPVGPSGGSSEDGRVLVLTDRTKHKELEEQLRQSHRLEAVGRLAGGIAHDFNNLLTAVLGNAALLMRSLPAAEPDHALAATIERAAWRAADLTRQLLGFSRQALLWLQTVDPGKILDEAAAAVKVRAGVELTVRRGEVWPVQADPTQMSQVFAALCLNALDAMPDGGRLTLTAENRVLDASEADGHLDARPGEFVCLAVEDTGHGIEASLLDKIFDPFFTTKPFGQGSGLGLAMVHGIVKQHQGWVRCQSETGRGSRFELYLPRVQSQPAMEADPLVLVAEADDTLRALAAAYLRQAGYDVLSAADGTEAVELFRREQARVELVILDARMLLSGREALRQMRAIRPIVRALLAASSPEELESTEGALGFVGRPYREAELLAAVKRAMR